jgi:hypothetical protein
MRHRTVGLGLVVGLMAGSALGQEAPAPAQPPLQGPRVQEKRAPHVQDDFSDGMKGREGRMGAQIPMRAYSEVIGKLRGDNASDDLRLSEDQEQKLGAIEKEYREATRAYAQERREKSGEPTRRTDGRAPADAPQRPRREAAQDMMRNGPKPGDYQTRIWAILNEKQQAHVKVELDKVREELQKRRGEEMMQRRIEQQRGVKPEAAPGRPGAEPERPIRDRVQRLMRRMAQLPEAERDQLIKRLEAEMDRRGIPETPEGERPPQR